MTWWVRTPLAYRTQHKNNLFIFLIEIKHAIDWTIGPSFSPLTWYPHFHHINPWAEVFSCHLTWGSVWWQGLAERTSKGVILCFKGLMHFHLSPCNSATTINKTWLRRTAGKRGMLDVKKSHSSSPTELPSEAGELQQLQWEEPPAQPTLN